MKKVMSLLLAVSIVAVLCACGSSKSNSPATTEEPKNTPEVMIQATTDDSASTLTEMPEATPTEEPKQLVFEEKYSEPIVILDDDYITISILARYEDRQTAERSNPPFYQLGFKLYIENKTDDKYLSVGFKNVSIDGVMNEGYYGDTWVSPGAKSYPTLVFNRYVGEDDKHPNVETLEDIVNVRGVVQVYYNTDGNKSGKGLEKAEFQFD